MSENNTNHHISRRFRRFLPVVVDVETAGFNPDTDALLEIAAVLIGMDDYGLLHTKRTVSCHIEPFPGANLDKKALQFTGIDPYNPLRLAKQEDRALEHIFAPIREEIYDKGCSRAILVGHNPFFDLGFIKAAVKRTNAKDPFHAFSTFDTATLGGLAYGQTVLARAVEASGMDWDHQQAHSAIYDAERTADLFCTVINLWNKLSTHNGS